MRHDHVPSSLIRGHFDNVCLLGSVLTTDLPCSLTLSIFKHWRPVHNALCYNICDVYWRVLGPWIWNECKSRKLSVYMQHTYSHTPNASNSKCCVNENTFLFFFIVLILCRMKSICYSINRQIHLFSQGLQNTWISVFSVWYGSTSFQILPNSEENFTYIWIDNKWQSDFLEDLHC